MSILSNFWVKKELHKLHERGLVHSNFNPKNLIFNFNKNVLLTGSEDYRKIKKKNRRVSFNAPIAKSNHKQLQKHYVSSISSLNLKNHSLVPMRSSFSIKHIESLSSKKNTKVLTTNNQKNTIIKQTLSSDIKTDLQKFKCLNSKRKENVSQNKLAKLKNLYYTMKRFNFLENIYSNVDSNLSKQSRGKISLEQNMNYVSDLGYLSPETIFSCVFNENSNHFSVGVLCYEMTFNKKPYDSTNLKNYIKDLQDRNVRVGVYYQR